MKRTTDTCKHLLITGANGGLGLDATARFLQAGHIVYALDICVDRLGMLHDPNLIVILADLTDSASIDQAYAQITRRTSHLDAVISLAGGIALGSLVEQDAALMQKVMDISFMGCVRIYQKFFPLIEASKGRFITVTSEYALLDALPFHGFYTSAKHALKAYHDSLRRELQFCHIKVIEIRPGAFATPMQNGIQDRFTLLLANTTHYKRQLTLMKGMMDKELRKAKNPVLFTNTLCKALEAKHPRNVYRVHNSLKMKLLSLLPASMQDWVLRIFFS